MSTSTAPTDLKAALARRNMSQHDLSLRTKIPASTISRYVHGLRMTDDHAARITKVVR